MLVRVIVIVLLLFAALASILVFTDAASFHLPRSSIEIRTGAESKVVLFEIDRVSRIFGPLVFRVNADSVDLLPIQFDQYAPAVVTCVQQHDNKVIFLDGLGRSLVVDDDKVYQEISSPDKNNECVDYLFISNPWSNFFTLILQTIIS